MTKPIADLSQWQDSTLIDYDLLCTQISGAIIRVCFGMREDPEYQNHYKEFTQRGMPVGLYPFAIDRYSAAAQYEFFRSLIAGKPYQLGTWLDVEHPGFGNTLSKRTVDNYLSLAKDMGAYTSHSKWQEIMNNSTDWAHRPLWVASYRPNVPYMPRPWKEWYLWQYTAWGRLPGYPKDLDLNNVNPALMAQIQPVGAPEPITEPTPTPAYPFRARVVTRHGLAVRKAPSTSGEFVRWLPENATVTVYAIQGDWWRIDPIQSLWSASQYGGEVLMERVPEYSVFLPIISGGGDTPVVPATILGVPQYSQRDPRWANIRLGTGAATIAQQGCLITAVTAVCRYYGKDTDPARLNRDLLRVDGYANGNLYKWWSLTSIYPDLRVKAYIDCQTVPAPLDKIDAELAAGRPPIVWVDFNPATAYNDMHWVVIIGHTEGRSDYLIMDPWTGKIVPFKTLYSDPARYIFRIVTYAKG